MPTSTLGAFLGMWEGKGASKDSAYSKAGPNSAQTNCNWSPNHGFLVCDQIVHLPDGVTQNDLSIYTNNETDHSYAFYGLSKIILACARQTNHRGQALDLLRRIRRQRHKDPL